MFQLFIKLCPYECKFFEVCKMKNLTFCAKKKSISQRTLIPARITVTNQSQGDLVLLRSLIHFCISLTDFSTAPCIITLSPVGVTNMTLGTEIRCTTWYPETDETQETVLRDNGLTSKQNQQKISNSC